jgi:hypothetical protein
MKTLKKVAFISILITAIFFCNIAMAQGLTTLFPFTSLFSLWSPIVPPLNLTGLPTLLPIGAFPTIQPISPITRIAQIPTATTTIATPILITTSWSGSWTSFSKTALFGPMSLILTEDLSAGTFTGTALLDLNNLVPVPITVSGAYTGIGLDISVSGIYSGLTPVTTGTGPFATTVLVPVDYLITFNFSIVGGLEIIGTYTINSTINTDFGSIYLTRI